MANVFTLFICSINHKRSCEKNNSDCSEYILNIYLFTILFPSPYKQWRDILYLQVILI